MVTSALASIPGHTDCPKVVVGRGGEGKVSELGLCVNRAGYLVS